MSIMNKNEVLNMAAVILSQSNFDKEVLESEKTVLVDFWASWCGPCRMVLPIVEEISEEYPEYKICKVNVDEQSELASRFHVRSIPTLLVFKGGQLVEQSVGAKNKDAILEMLK